MIALLSAFVAIAAAAPRGAADPIPCLGTPAATAAPIADAFVAPSPASLRRSNTGASPLLAAGTQGVRALVAFESVAAALVDDHVATLVVPTARPAGTRPPPSGAVLAAYAIPEFVEGNGVFRGPKGDGPGVTFACFEAADVADPQSACNAEWDDAWFDEPSATGMVAAAGEPVLLDVSDDVRKGVVAWAVVVMPSPATAGTYGFVAGTRESPGASTEAITLVVAPAATCLPPIPALTTELLARSPDAVLMLPNGAPDSTLLYVVSQAGFIRVLNPDTGLFFDEEFLSLRDVVWTEGLERGLLSMAFHPDFANNRQFFVFYTTFGGDVHVARLTAPTDLVADRSSLEVLLVVGQETDTHNGGHLLFGPDGFLFISTGDGGPQRDALCRAQERSALVGKILRIDVDAPADPATGLAFAVPADNPFADAAYPENLVWALGLRNPWRFDFDLDGGFFVTDVGQNTWEEVNHLPAGVSGANFGWNTYEAFECFRTDDSPCVDVTTCGDDDDILTFPVFHYRHGFRCSVIGGGVYRGWEIPAARGAMFFGDWCSGEIWHMRNVDGVWVEEVAFTVGLFFGDISGFGTDASGEMYVISGSEILKIVAA